MKHEKTQARIAIENAMREHCTANTPLRAERIAELSGVNVTLVRHYIGRFVNRDMAYNVGTRSTSAYVWREPVAREVTPSVSRISSIPYRGERALPVRPGSMDAYALPSVEAGETVERKRPMLIGAQP